MKERLLALLSKHISRLKVNLNKFKHPEQWENPFIKKIARFLEEARLKTPTILQMEAVECGAAALAIVLAHYKKFVPLEELRVACGVSRDGSKAINMLKAARYYGLEASGAQGEPEALFDLPFPFIVFWKFNHFVVVEDITPSFVYINDPATGRRRVDPQEFNRSFTGIVMVFTPGPDFKPAGQPPRLLDTLKARAEGSKSALIFLILISVALILPGIIIPGFSKIFIDDVLVRGLKHWLPLLLVGMGLTALLRSFLTGLQQYYFLRLHMKLMITQAAAFIWHVLRLPLAFFEQRYAGDITNRIESTDEIAGVVSRDLSTSAVSIISMFFFMIIMLLYNWQLTLIGLLTAAVNTSVLLLTARQLADMSRRLAQDRGKLEGIEIGGLHTIETLKSSNLDTQFFKRWAGAHAKTIQTQQKIALFHELLSALPSLLSGLSSVIILGLGSYYIMQGSMTVGTLVAFQSLLASFNGPIETLLSVGVQLQEVRADITRLNDVFEHQKDPRYKRSLQENGSDENLEVGNVEFRNVTFGYSPLDPPLIENLSFTLAPGGCIALVGATGSGKSTIAKLLCGLYPVWSGEILINHQPLLQLSSQAIAQTLSFVDQDILLFEGSIRENLTLWDPTLPQALLEQAAKDACVWELISNREHRFESKVEEFAQNFSGGERQRLEIARALVRNPKILVLDEGTSALDAITEQSLIKNLRTRGCSLLLITHRLNIIRDSDEIIVLNKGKTVERGSHEQLMALNGAYAHLVGQTA